MWSHKFIRTAFGQFFKLGGKVYVLPVPPSLCLHSYSGISYVLGYFQAKDESVVT